MHRRPKLATRHEEGLSLQIHPTKRTKPIEGKCEENSSLRRRQNGNNMATTRQQQTNSTIQLGRILHPFQQYLKVHFQADNE